MRPCRRACTIICAKRSGEQRAVRQAGERVELREVGEPLLAVEALQARAQDRGDRIEEVELLRGEASSSRHRAKGAAHLRVAGHRNDRGGAGSRPFEGKRAALGREVFAGLQHVRDGIVGRHRRARVVARDRGALALGVEPASAAGDELALLGAALEVADGVRAERRAALLHGVGAELARLPAGERRLAERRDALLVAQVRGLARLLRLALGEVARVDDQHAALGVSRTVRRTLDREGAAVLPAGRSSSPVRVRCFTSSSCEARISLDRFRPRGPVGAHSQELVARVAERRAGGLVEVEQPVRPASRRGSTMSAEESSAVRKRCSATWPRFLAVMSRPTPR